MKRKLCLSAVAIPLSLALAWGCMYAMITGLNLPAENGLFLMRSWILCAIVGCLLFCLPSGELLALSCCLAAVYWLWDVKGISLSIRALITRLSLVYGSAYGWKPLEFAGIDWQTTSLDLLLAAWGGLVILAAVGGVIQGRGRGMAVVFSLPPLIATLVVTDTPPDALPLFLQITAVSLLLVTRFVARRPGQGVKLTALAALPTALVLGSLFLIFPQDTYVNRADEQLDAIVAWWQETIVSPFKGGSGLGQDFTPTPTASASTRLGSLGPRRVFPYPVMEVTADFSGSLYLRGQDYDVYDGLSWTASLDRTEILEKGPRSSHRGSVTVTTLRPMDVVYIPSYPSRNYVLNDGRLDNTDEETEFSWSVSSISVFADLASSQYYNQPDLSSYRKLSQSTLDWADAYAQQVLEEGGLSDLALTYASHAQIAQIIVDHVANSARYSLNTGRMDDSYEDFAQWFLEESDTGYCVHFATAATVLLRAAGVPARYVTGYMVNCEAGKTVTVQSDRAHAWVEYFDTTANTWIIAEPTPPNLEEDEPETESLTAPPPVTEAPTAGKDETAAPTHDTTSDSTRPTGANKPGKTEPNSHTALWKILRWFVLAAVLFAAVILQRLVRIALRRRALTGGPNRRALGLWQEVARVSAFLNREPPEELLELAQKAKFSQHRLTREDLRLFIDWLREARLELDRRPIHQRLWCKYVLALW